MRNQECKNNNDYTALMYAISNNHIESSNMLIDLESGIVANNGVTAFDFAIFNVKENNHHGLMGIASQILKRAYKTVISSRFDYDAIDTIIKSEMLQSALSEIGYKDLMIATFNGDVERARQLLHQCGQSN